VFFEDGSGSRFEILISTLPLNKVLKMAEIELDEPPDPYTSVLVLNIGAERGAECPEEHWVYLPQSRSGFHRVGFYSNVDVTFLPTSGRSDRSRVSIYVERAFQGGKCPVPSEVETYKEEVVKELREWRWIGDVEVVDHTWIDVAYTWSFPGSNWRQKALKFLEERGIYQIGRYGRWVFQGISDSTRDGLLAGEVLG
ncbi:MAG: protoporphyrinogen oxidase-like protein, partial [Nitrososphaerota archaeon]